MPLNEKELREQFTKEDAEKIDQKLDDPEDKARNGSVQVQTKLHEQ